MITDKLSKAKEEYARKTGWRALVNLIPYIGSSLDVLLTAKAQEVTQQRIESLVSEVSNQLKLIEESKVDKSFLDSDEWYDLVFRTFEKAIRTRSTEKIQLYSKILVGTLISPENREHSEGFLDILADLSETEVKLARLVYELKDISIQKKDEHGSQKPNIFLDRCTFIDKNDIQFYMKRLERVGLVNEEVGGMWIGYGGGWYKVTPTFDKLMKVLS